MKGKIKVYSQKTGKKITVKTVKANSGSYGWCLTGWDNSRWVNPVNK